MLARRQIGGTFTRRALVGAEFRSGDAPEFVACTLRRFCRGDVDVVECARENEGAPLFSFNQNCVPPEWERVEDCSKDRAADAN